MFILPSHPIPFSPPPSPSAEKQQLWQYVFFFLTTIRITVTLWGCQPPATRFSSRGSDAAMRAPPAPSTTTAAVCTPSVPLCPTSSFVQVRAVPRGHRPCAEEPRATAGAPAPPPVRHSVQEVQMLSKDCPPKIRSRLAPQTLQFPEVKTRFSATLPVLGQQMLTTCVWFRMTCLDSLTYVVTVWCIVMPLNVLKCDHILFFGVGNK